MLLYMESYALVKGLCSLISLDINVNSQMYEKAVIYCCYNLQKIRMLLSHQVFIISPHNGRLLNSRQGCNYSTD